MVKDIFVSRELPIFVRMKCEMMNFCVVNRDLYANMPSHEPLMPAIFVQEMRNYLRPVEYSLRAG